MRSLLAFAAIILVSLNAHARSAPESFADMVEKLSPAVVNISTKQKVIASASPFNFKGLPQGEEFDQFREFFEQFGGDQMEEKERDVTSLGSGFVIDPKGYIVTNNHVIEKADSITVTFSDDKQYDAELVGRDAKTDLALLKIEPDHDLPYVTFGSSDEMRVGDWVVAIGNPFGLGGSVSAGIVSARSRNINSGPFDDFIQTDAAINRGNSGGPLFNTRGEVIGVNSAIFSPSGGNVGIGFSIPSAMAQPVLKQLREFGRTHRGWLGVKIQQVTDEIADSLELSSPRGALVLDVNKDSPAADAGIENGDIILTFDDKPVKEMRFLPRLVAETKVGTRAKVSVWRKGREKSLTVKLGEMPEEETAIAPPSEEKVQKKVAKSETVLGISIAPIDASVREEFSIDKSINGLVILEIKPKTPAAESGLQKYDIILEANQEEVHSVKDFEAALKDARNDKKDHMLLRINRRGSYSFITIQTKE